MSRRTLLDVADLLRARGRIPGYGVATTAGGLRVAWSAQPAVSIADVHGHRSARSLWVGRSHVFLGGRGWVARAVAAIEAAVHEDARRNDRWGPEVWAEVSR